ncbi:MAG: FAD-dependent monooxygenase [Bradyrhizobiaceae bacterium]|nr:FAD-dependent monooxygenase [Bradyrhizobiaceae bacterium]
MARARTILVAGAGIGGLAAAIALARAGFRALVLERAAHLEELGAGLQLTPNATRALERLGALEAVKRHAVAVQELIVASCDTGIELARASLDDAVIRFGAPWLVTLRADLHRALHAAASDLVDIELELGTEVTDFAAHARGATALTTRTGKSKEQTGIALVGADGLWSNVRARLHGEELPDFPRLVAWRALVPANALPAVYAEPIVRLWLSHDAHVVHYPVAGGEQINLVAVFRDDWQSESWSAPAQIGDIPVAYDDWAEMPRTLIEAASTFTRWALADRPPLKRWSEGRVTLLGDAAHPMLPFLAQGAGAALEDAVALSRHVRHHGDVADAFRAYETERAPRTTRLQNAARFTGRIYHARGPLRWARDIKLRWDAEKLIDRHSWIYRYRPI